MRVLLTRAAEDAARTRATLEALGHRVLISPVISIEATGVDWPGGVVDGLLATSAQAFATMSKDWGPKPEARRLLPLWLVGHRTKQAARDRNFAGPTIVASNAVALAYEMGKRCAHQNLIYLAGRHRKLDIETALSVATQKVEVLEVYEAANAVKLDDYATKALANNTLDAVMHFSRRSAEIFLELARRTAIETRALQLCLSEDVAVPLAKAGWPVRIAAEPSEASLIATIQGFVPT